MSLPESDIEKLITESFEAKELSYSPYSEHKFGAALMTDDGLIIRGCNVENVTYGLTVCAERTAICKAVSEGHKKFKALAIASDLVQSFVSPCGMCRQTLVEFGLDIQVIMTKTDRSYKIMTALELLPDPFLPEQLDEERISSS